MICLSDIFERFWFSIWLLWQGLWLLKYNSFTFLSWMDPSITSLTLFILRRTLSTCRMIIPTLIALLWWCFVLACGGLLRSASYPVCKKRKCVKFGNNQCTFNMRYYGQNQLMWRKNYVRRFVKTGKTIIYD